MDTYQSFSELKRSESEFEIELSDRGSEVTILAPHGGKIEPHTSEIARLIAGRNYNYFCFNGMKQEGNEHLHITSHRYDEEQAITLVKKSNTVIAVHGCLRKEPIVYLGGLDRALKQRISRALALRNIPVSPPRSKISGSHRNNICNRGISGKGVQLEISRALRNSPTAWSEIASAVRLALSEQYAANTVSPRPAGHN